MTYRGVNVNKHYLEAVTLLTKKGNKDKLRELRLSYRPMTMISVFPNRISFVILQFTISANHERTHSILIRVLYVLHLAKIVDQLLKAVEAKQRLRQKGE